MKTVVAVVGGGFKGIVAAKYLVDQGAEVVLIEQGKNLGGIHVSIPWDGFKLDLGCHLFSNEDNRTTELLLDLLEDTPNGISPKIKSLYQGKQTDGIEYPDFSHLPRNKIAECLFDLLEHASINQVALLAQPEIQTNLEVYLVNRYGVKVASLLTEALKKLLLSDAKDISSVAFSAIPAARVSLVSSELAVILKKSTLLDELILRSSADDPMRYIRHKAFNFEYRCFYPANGGMGAFGISSSKYLLKKGVTIRAETTIKKITTLGDNKVELEFSDADVMQCDHVLWTSGSQALANTLGLNLDMKSSVHAIPMVLFYFDVPDNMVGEYSWVQDFDQTHFVYRASAPSTLGAGTAPKGRAYVLAEVIAKIDSDIYQNPDLYLQKVWDEIVSLGICAGLLPIHYKIIKTPVSYRFPKPCFFQKKSLLDECLDQLGNVHLFDEWIFGKAACVKEVMSFLDQHNLVNND